MINIIIDSCYFFFKLRVIRDKTFIFFFFNKYPKIFAPKNNKTKDSQEPTKPVFPVIRIFFLLIFFLNILKFIELL